MLGQRRRPCAGPTLVHQWVNDQYSAPFCVLTVSVLLSLSLSAVLFEITDAHCEHMCFCDRSKHVSACTDLLSMIDTSGHLCVVCNT